MKTLDQKAFEILINPTLSDSARAGKIKSLWTGGDCPACGHDGPHDDNGLTGDERSFCCTECGEHWDA